MTVKIAKANVFIDDYSVESVVSSVFYALESQTQVSYIFVHSFRNVQIRTIDLLAILLL